MHSRIYWRKYISFSRSFVIVWKWASIQGTIPLGKRQRQETVKSSTYFENVGDMNRHGPHHRASKSTTTSLPGVLKNRSSWDPLLYPSQLCPLRGGLVAPLIHDGFLIGNLEICPKETVLTNLVIWRTLSSASTWTTGPECGIPVTNLRVNAWILVDSMGENLLVSALRRPDLPYLVLASKKKKWVDRGQRLLTWLNIKLCIIAEVIGRLK